MKRREFIGILGGVGAWPLAAWAVGTGRNLQGRIPGFAVGRQPTKTDRGVSLGLAGSGLSRGAGYCFEYRWADSNNDRLPALLAT
jgi:hypothetical protein